MSKILRKCKFCENEFKDGVEMVQSVATGDWICMSCFEKRMKP